MAKLLLLNKPFQVLSQFSDNEGRRTLAEFISLKGVYPAGRLDFDSEGLLLLTDDGGLQHTISHPQKKMMKTYYVQVEGEPDVSALNALERGVLLKDGKTRPAKAEKCSAPEWLWPRTPPIRERKNIKDTWLRLTISEGKNRQVRRMTAAVGFPTLRLIRYSIGSWSLGALQPGDYITQEVHMPKQPRR